MKCLQSAVGSRLHELILLHVNGTGTVHEMAKCLPSAIAQSSGTKNTREEISHFRPSECAGDNIKKKQLEITAIFSIGI